MANIVAIAVGGALGSVLRHAVSHWGTGLGQLLPWGTLIVNLVGCFAIGLLAAHFLANEQYRESVRLGVIVGLLGGFTTFSAFGLQTLELINQGSVAKALAYVAISNVLGVALAWAGFRLASG